MLTAPSSRAGPILLMRPVPERRRRRLGPLLGDIEVAELLDEPPVLRELGLLGRLDGLEGGRPAGRGVPELFRGAKVGSAQPVVVLRLRLQAADSVLLRLEGHGARPPMLSDPLPARDAIAAQERGQEHGACSPPPREPRPSARRLTHRRKCGSSAWGGLPPRELAPARLRLPREGTSAPARVGQPWDQRNFRRREFKRVAGPGALCGPHGPDPELLCKAAVSGGHLGRRNGAAAAGAGEGRQRL